MIEPPEIAGTAAQLAAVLHLTIPREEIRAVMGPRGRRRRTAGTLLTAP